MIWENKSAVIVLLCDPKHDEKVRYNLLYTAQSIYVLVISQYEWVILVVTQVRSKNGLITKIAHKCPGMYITGLYPSKYVDLLAGFLWQLLHIHSGATLQKYATKSLTN